MLTRKNKIFIAAGGVSAVLILGGIYSFWGAPYLESRAVERIEGQVNGLIENPYTSSIKDGVSREEVQSLEKEVASIKNERKRSELKAKTDALLEQAGLQTDLKTELKEYVRESDGNKLNEDSIRILIGKAGGIKNTKVRDSIYKEGNELLDRLVYAHYVKGEADKLTADNPGQYYAVKGLNDSVQYDGIKAEVEKKLASVKTQIDQRQKSQEQDKKNKEDAALAQAAKGSTYSFEKGSSKQERVSEAEYQLISKLVNNSSLVGRKVLAVGAGKVQVLTSEQGSDGSPTVRVVADISYNRNRSGESVKLFEQFTISGDKVRSSGFSIGSSNSDDVQIPSNTVSVLQDALR